MTFDELFTPELISTLGFPIIGACILFAAFYKIIERIMNENKEREKNLVDINAQAIAAVQEVSKSIENSDKINQELSETNKMLLEVQAERLKEMDTKLDKIMESMVEE